MSGRASTPVRFNAVKIICAATATFLVSSAAHADVLISQYYEGASNNKYIELHNPTEAPIAMTGYHLTLWNNAAAEDWKTDGSSPSQSYDLSAIVMQPGEHYLLAHASAVLPSYASSGANARSGSVINFNGDDSVVLYRSGSYSLANILDAVGFTDLGNEGQDKSFHRISNDIGYDTVIGSNTAAFPAAWERRTLAEVDSAGTDDPWYLASQAAAVPPTLDSFTISSDAAATMTPGVTLSFSASGANATELIASESADFAGAGWQPFATAPKFTLSATAGPKTVHFKLKNGSGESAALSDSIELTPYAYPGTLVFTQYYKGLSNNKHLEIANLSDVPVDLIGWNLVRWTNQDAENWQFTGIGVASPSQSISLSTVNTDSLGSTILASGAVIVISNNQATGPATAFAPALTTGNLSFNGNDSIALYSGAAGPSDLVDVVSFTDAGNEGADKAFVRLSAAQGFGFAAGSSSTDFNTIWQEVAVATVDAAVPGQSEHLGTYPGSTPAGYDGWAAGYGLTGTVSDDDDDDGSSNLLEYATGTVPNNGGSLPDSILTTVGATLTVTWAKGGQAAIDPALTWIIEASTSMADGTWSTEAVLNFVNGPTTVSADYAIESGTLRGFLRLKVVRQP